jgi:hypothetical protein
MYLARFISLDPMFVVGFCSMWLKWHDIAYSITAQFAETPAVGTKLPNRDVSSMVAIGDRPDMMRIAQFGRD